MQGPREPEDRTGPGHCEASVGSFGKVMFLHGYSAVPRTDCGNRQGKKQQDKESTAMVPVG